MGCRQAAMVAQEICKRFPRLHVAGDFGTIEFKRQGLHLACTSRTARRTVEVCKRTRYASCWGTSPATSLAIAHCKASSDLSPASLRSATFGSRQGRSAAAASTTEAAPLQPFATANAIELANAPLVRTTLKKPQRIGGSGRGMAKARMISSEASEGEYCPRKNSPRDCERVPFSPAIRTWPPSAIKQPGQSEAGSASATLPPIVP